MTKQPEALRLADLLEDWAKDYATTDFDCDMGDQAAAELRRLHEVNQELLALVQGSKALVLEKLNSGYDTEYWQQILSELDAAIAKATGEQQ